VYDVMYATRDSPPNVRMGSFLTSVVGRLHERHVD